MYCGMQPPSLDYTPKNHTSTTINVNVQYRSTQWHVLKTHPIQWRSNYCLERKRKSEFDYHVDRFVAISPSPQLKTVDRESKQLIVSVPLNVLAQHIFFITSFDLP